MKTADDLDRLANLRRRYTDEALKYLPRLIQMVDRNPYSPTYGSFDRSYWHYRTMDFPCGMYQEFCLPLALAYAHPFPDNPYHRVERIRELALAGVDYAMRSAHKDGSCDDYFPYERALGALVFSLNAITETCLVLDEKRPEWVEFFKRRADFLAANNETGQLTNHQALAALALYNTFLVTGEQRYKKASDDYLAIVKEWFHPEEGWFQEYEGADPGYQTCTVAFLARLYRKSQNPAILEMLNPAVDFCWHFMHPDGSYGGEYGSRNTYHFYPSGFEIMAPFNPRAAQVADHFLTRSLPNRTRYFNDDDRMCAHYVYDWMHAYLDFSQTRAETPLNRRTPFRKYFHKAGMVVMDTGEYHAALNLHKGGVIKIITPDGALYSDTGLIGNTENGQVLVSHMIADYDTSADTDLERYSVAGSMCLRKSRLATPFTQILFRLVNMTIGRFWPNFLRATLQRLLITGKTTTEYRFRREFQFAPDGVRIINRMEKPGSAPTLVSLHIGSDATSIYVANSNVYQNSVLLPWRPMTRLLSSLNANNEGTEIIDVPIPAADSAR